MFILLTANTEDRVKYCENLVMYNICFFIKNSENKKLIQGEQWQKKTQIHQRINIK